MIIFIINVSLCAVGLLWMACADSELQKAFALALLAFNLGVAVTALFCKNVGV